MLKAIIVGCGRIAGIMNHSLSSHGGAYLAQEGVSIIACVDSSKEKSIRFSEIYHCKAEQDLIKTIEKYQPDIISVCTPDHTHFSITKKIFEAKHLPNVIFLEKPACNSKKEFDYLVRLSSKKNVQIVLNHSRRFDQHHQQLRERINAEEFGELKSVYATYYSGWLHNGIHIVDTLYYLFGDPINVDEITSVWESQYENDPSMELKASFKKHNAIIYLSRFDESDYQLFEIDLRFNQARLRLENFGDRIILETKYMNEIGENVIEIVDNGLTDRTKTPMQQAINLIFHSIEENNSGLLDGYLLKDMEETMNTIWKSKKEYEKHRLK